MSVEAPLVLASASAVRLRLLLAAGIPCVADPAHVDEDAIKTTCRREGFDVLQTAAALASAKAHAVSHRWPGRLVLGADQMLECEGRWFDKPAGLDAAAQALRRLRGRSHRLISAAAVVEAGVPPWSHTAVASLTVRDFTDDFLAGYLERVGPEVCSSVGAYQLEGPGVQLFSAIEGDYFCILGLPLLPLLDHLRSRGVIGQ